MKALISIVLLVSTLAILAADQTAAPAPHKHPWFHTNATFNASYRLSQHTNDHLIYLNGDRVLQCQRATNGVMRFYTGMAVVTVTPSHGTNIVTRVSKSPAIK